MTSLRRALLCFALSFLGYQAFFWLVLRRL